MKSNFPLKFKLFDIIILAVVIIGIISSIVGINIAYAKKDENSVRMVQIYCRNELVIEINLDEVDGVFSYTLQKDKYENLRDDMVITFDEEKGVCISYVNCVDYRCKKAGWINKFGEQLVCLPNQVRVYIESSDGSIDQDIVLGG